MSLKIGPEELELARKFGGMLLGLDESGICNYAGPITYAAALIDYSNPENLPRVQDCKQLNDKALTNAFHNLTRSQFLVSYKVFHVHARQIDRNGTRLAKVQGMKRVFRDIDNACSDKIKFAVIDFQSIDNLRVPQLAIQKADQIYYCVAAASIIAKFCHDDFMRSVHQLHPEYNWESNKGCICPQHGNLIRQHGLTPYHRRTWCRKLV